MSSASKRQIIELVFASEGESVQVMDFDVTRFAAAHAAFVNVRAASPVALVDRAAKPGRNSPTALTRRYRRRRLAVRFDSLFRTEALLLEEVDQQPHRLEVQFPQTHLG